MRKIIKVLAEYKNTLEKALKGYSKLDFNSYDEKFNANLNQSIAYLQKSRIETMKLISK